MNLIYKCPECDKIIDHLEVDKVDEESLGFNILTEEEREDIIEVEGDNTYINVACDECVQDYPEESQLTNMEIH